MLVAGSGMYNAFVSSSACQAFEIKTFDRDVTVLAPLPIP
jgi:hypothetical protein